MITAGRRSRSVRSLTGVIPLPPDQAHNDQKVGQQAGYRWQCHVKTGIDDVGVPAVCIRDFTSHPLGALRNQRARGVRHARDGARGADTPGPAFGAAR